MLDYEHKLQWDHHTSKIQKSKPTVNVSMDTAIFNRFKRGNYSLIVEGIFTPDYCKEKLTEIERENRILYEKMLTITNRSPTSLKGTLIFLNPWS